MERDRSDMSNDKPTPEVPNDIEGMIEEIKERAGHRQRAVDMMLAKAEAAQSFEAREHWLKHAEEMQKVLDEHHRQFPEIFD